MQLIQTRATVTSVMTQTLGNSQTLTSPIQYERSVLYPESDYFVIVDRMEGTQPWVFRNIFRPTSLMVTPSVDTNKDHVYTESEVGHVNGALTLGSTPFNWQALPYTAETATGVTANSLTWTTTNPYGKAVTMNLVAAPSSEILVEKHVGRIGGYGASSEVFNPVVYFRTAPAISEYRVTALLSRYATEQAKTATEIPVTGTGHALQIHSSDYDDYIYTGKGVSSFTGFTTDADTAFIRKTGTVEGITIIEGSYRDDRTDRLISLSERSDFFTLVKTGTSTEYRTSYNDEARGSVFGKRVYASVDLAAGIYPAFYQTSAVTENATESISYRKDPSTDWLSAPSHLFETLRRIFLSL